MPRGVDYKVPMRDVQEAHRAHLAGWSLRALARMHWRQWGYASADSALEGLRRAMRALELPVRDRVEATRLARTLHGELTREATTDTVGSALPADLSGFVYFIQAVNGGPVKIGWTGTEAGIGKRLAALQTASPWRLVVRAVVRGPVELETTFHRKYAALRLGGEWFQPDPKLARACGASLEPGPYDDTQLARVRWHLSEIRRRITAGESDLAVIAAADADELVAVLESESRELLADLEQAA